MFVKATTAINLTNYAYSINGNNADTNLYSKNLTILFDKIKDGIIAPPEGKIVGNLSMETVKFANQKLETTKPKLEKW